MKGTRVTRIICISVIILASGCAKISSPSGGPRDKVPPVFVKSIPEAGALNFKGNKVTITFDEYITADNLNEKFLISPPMKKKPGVFVRGKNIVVEFEEKLKDSTTYTLYFQDGIKDLNEGNILTNFQFYFSTGSVRDSLSVTGNVYHTLNLEVPEKTQVLMYRRLDDSAVMKYIPDYIARADDNGYFRFDNVREGKYKLYALKDDDNSKNYNNREEEFAFLDSAIEVTSEKNYIPFVTDTIKKSDNKLPNTFIPVSKEGAQKKTAETGISGKEKEEKPVVVPEGEFKLYSFKADRKAHYLTGTSRELKYLFTYTLSLPPDTMKVIFSIPDVKEDSYYIENSRNRDTIKVWLTDSTLYSKPQISTHLKYPFTDTLGRLGYKLDTVSMRYTSPRLSKTAKARKVTYKVETNIGSGSLKPGERIVLNSQTPFRVPDTTRIRIFEVNDKAQKRIPATMLKDNSNSCRYFINARFDQGKKYLFIADSASFSNIYNEFSDSIGIKFALKDPETLSQITFSLTNYEGGRIVQILNKTENIIREFYMKKDGKQVFPLLDPDTYRARVIYDINGDGKWTTGDFDTHRQPEPVSYYDKEITLKAGFEVENDWDIRLKNFKDQTIREKPKGK
jgi:hypothetical protein